MLGFAHGFSLIIQLVNERQGPPDLAMTGATPIRKVKTRDYGPLHLEREFPRDSKCLQYC